MAHSAEVEIKVLHTTKTRDWCQTCLFTTDQETIFMRIGQDGQSFTYCLQGQHRVR